MSFDGKVGFIGAGKMGASIIEGLAQGGLLAAESISIYDVDSGRTAELNAKLKVKTTGSLEDLVNQADIVFVCVKPDQFSGIAGAIKSAWPARKPTIVSIMAGVKTSRIKELIGPETPVIRVMPNVACLIRKGATGVSADKSAPDAANKFVYDLFEFLGGAVMVAEEKLDAVTALSGSGPAYVFMFIEALTDAGVKFGLDRASAKKLAVKTVAGAALMAEQTDADTLELRARVSSPGGTTVAATSKLETGGFRGIVIDAVEAAYRRSVELGK
ncbi:MAG: pyrroline-5-carboxylate reductase [bacterium]